MAAYWRRHFVECFLENEILELGNIIISDDPEVARRQWGAIWAKKKGAYVAGGIHRSPYSGGGYSSSNGSSGRSSSGSSQPITPRVFISFHIQDEAQVNLLRHQAQNSDKMEFTDYSVKEPFDEAWKTQCAERIRQSTVLIVAIGEDTHLRPAVLWEIEKAKELGKPVIGMRIHSDMNHKIPEPLVRDKDQVTNWNQEEIQAAIDKAQRPAGAL